MATKTKAQRAARMAANNARITAANTKAGATVARQAAADASALASMNKVRTAQGLPEQAAIGVKAPGRSGTLSINQTTNEVIDEAGTVLAKGSSLSDALAKENQLSSGSAPNVAGRPDLYAVAPGANQEVKSFFDQSTQTAVTPTTATPEQMAAQADGTLDSFNKAQGLTYLDGSTFKDLQPLLNESDLIRGPDGQIWLRQGLTPEQVQARAETSVDGTGGASNLTQAESFNVDVPDTISTDTIDELMSTPVTESEFNAMLGEIQVAQDEILELMVPTDAEQAIKEEIGALKAEIEKTLVELSMGLNNVEDQPIAMQFITGQQASIQRSAEAKLQNLARLEENLLYELGLEQEARAVQASVAQTKLGYLQTNLDTAFKVKQMLQQEEDSLFNRTRALKQDAQTALASILDMMAGIDETDMTAAQQKQLQDMAIAAGVPYSLLTSGLSNVKKQMMLKATETDTPGSVYTSEQLDLINTINDDMRGDQDVKDFTAIRNGYQRVKDGAALDSGQGDLAVVYGYMKMLDPTSVVREGEFATAENTSGVPEWIRAQYNKVIGEGRLSKDTRSGFISASEELYNTAEGNYQNAYDFYASRARQAGLDPSSVLFDATGGSSDSDGSTFIPLDKSYSNIDALLTDHPEASSLIDAYRREFNDDEILQYIEQNGGIGFTNDLSMSQNGSPLEIAQAYLGLSSGDSKQAKTLSAFFKKAGGVEINPSTTAWCAAFLNSVLGSAGIKGTGSLMAQSFLKFGSAVSKPSKGDIVVFERGARGSGLGHVGIIAGINKDGSLQVLGGNQSGSVNIQTFQTNRVLGYRRIDRSSVRNYIG